MPISPGPLVYPHDVVAFLQKRHPDVLAAIEAEAVAAERARIRAAVERYLRASQVVHSAYDGECEHGFGPPATKCPNGGCPDRELAEAEDAVLDIIDEP